MKGTIRIHKDIKMFISEWLIFLLQGATMIFISFTLVDIISNFKTESLKILGLIIIVFFMAKMFWFLRIPQEYYTEMVTDELKDKK